MQKRHELGSALLYPFEREDGSRRRHGPRLMVRLADAFGMKEGVLNKHEQFAASFIKEEVAHLAGVRLPDGDPLAWSQVRLLVEVKDKKQLTRKPT